MRKESAFALLALVCISTTSLAQDPKKLFSVPFFIENLPPAMPSVLRADFTLQHPAILESFIPPGTSHSESLMGLRSLHRRVAAGAFGFLILIQVFEGPER
jgi:hypothetical protein